MSQREHRMEVAGRMTIYISESSKDGRGKVWYDPTSAMFGEEGKAFLRERLGNHIQVTWPDMGNSELIETDIPYNEVLRLLST